MVAKTQKLLPARLGPWPPEPVVHRERLGPPLGHHSHRFFLVLDEGTYQLSDLEGGNVLCPKVPGKASPIATGAFDTYLSNITKEPIHAIKDR